MATDYHLRGPNDEICTALTPCFTSVGITPKGIRANWPPNRGAAGAECSGRGSTDAASYDKPTGSTGAGAAGETEELEQGIARTSTRAISLLRKAVNFNPHGHSI